MDRDAISDAASTYPDFQILDTFAFKLIELFLDIIDECTIEWSLTDKSDLLIAFTSPDNGTSCREKNQVGKTSHRGHMGTIFLGFKCITTIGKPSISGPFKIGRHQYSLPLYKGRFQCLVITFPILQPLYK